MIFEVLGKPRGKQRPRFARRGNFITTYNSKTTSDYEKLVKLSAIEQCKEDLNKEYAGNVKMYIKAIFKPNKSISKKKFESLIDKPYLHKPDFDNIAKIICDALNGVAFKDDNQISVATVEKVYGNEDKVIVLLGYEESDRDDGILE